MARIRLGRLLCDSLVIAELSARRQENAGAAVAHGEMLCCSCTRYAVAADGCSAAN